MSRLRFNPSQIALLQSVMNQTPNHHDEETIHSSLTCNPSTHTSIFVKHEEHVNNNQSLSISVLFTFYIPWFCYGTICYALSQTTLYIYIPKHITYYQLIFAIYFGVFHTLWAVVFYTSWTSLLMVLLNLLYHLFVLLLTVYKPVFVVGHALGLVCFCHISCKKVPTYILWMLRIHVLFVCVSVILTFAFPMYSIQTIPLCFTILISQSIIISIAVEEKNHFVFLKNGAIQ